MGKIGYRILKILLFIFVSWFVVTVFFYCQHYIVIRKYTMNEKIDFKDMIVMVREISVESHEASPRYRRVYENYQGLWYWKASEHLQEKLRSLFIRAAYFYSMPYKFNRDDGILRIKGMVIPKKGESHDDLYQKFDIYAYDEDLRYSGRSMGLNNSSGSNIHLFEMRDDASLGGKKYQVIVEDKQNKEIWTFHMQPQWDVVTYTFFDTRRVTYEFSPKRKIEKFLTLMRQGQKEEAFRHVIPGLEKSFPWHSLEHEHWTNAGPELVRYEGTYMGYNDVYSVNITFGEFSHQSTGPVINAVADQKIYFAESGDLFYLVDAGPVNVFSSPVTIYY